MRFQIFSRRTIRGKRWYWRMRAGNGEVIAQSEGYRNRSDAIETVALVRTEAAAAAVHFEQDHP